MSIRVITIGKKHDSGVSDGIERYQKRLKRPFDLEWVILPNSPLSGDQARQNESSGILNRLNANDYVILLDETGKLLDSPALSKLLLSPLESSKQLVIVIGGAYGVDSTVRNRANFTWSLSPLVFPHQIVRLILTEQIYRSQQIANNHPYHHV